MKKVFLSNQEGIARLSGTDENGATWTETEAEGFACEPTDPEEGCTSEDCFGHGEPCAICGLVLLSGWRCYVCLDGGDIVCLLHIEWLENGITFNELARREEWNPIHFAGREDIDKDIEFILSSLLHGAAYVEAGH